MLVGFDGFVDTLFHCVDQRTGTKAFQRLSTLVSFSKRVRCASCQSTNIEVVPLTQTIGGNAPLLSQALLSLGIPSTLIGACGYPVLHPLFRPLKARGMKIHSIASPGLTTALEFTDGKLFLGNMGELNGLTASEALSRLPRGLISSLLSKAEVLATVNWTMMPLVEQFWDFLLENGRLLRKDRPCLFVDLSDPAKRPEADLKRCLGRLHRLSRCCRVTLGLNRSESHQVCKVLGLPLSSLKRNAERIFTKLSLHSVIVHSRSEAVVASAEGIAAETILPILRPVRLTGAGDTFNAGYIASMLRHLPPDECLREAIAVSREFVKTGKQRRDR